LTPIVYTSQQPRELRECTIEGVFSTRAHFACTERDDPSGFNLAA